LNKLLKHGAQSLIQKVIKKNGRPSKIRLFLPKALVIREKPSDRFLLILDIQNYPMNDSLGVGSAQLIS